MILAKFFSPAQTRKRVIICQAVSNPCFGAGLKFSSNEDGVP